MNDAQALSGSDSEIRALAQPVFDEVMAAHEAADYARLLPHLSAEMQEAMTEETFEEIVGEHLASLGDLSATDYLGSLHKADATQVLWKARYSESDAEVLWQLFLAQVDGKVQVVGLLFS